MIRIALITLHTPTLTNYRGASALPYHLIAFRPEGIEIKAWSFNLNGCDSAKIKESEEKLGSKIHVIPACRKIKFLTPAPVRLLLPKPLLGYLTLDSKTKSEIKSYLNHDDSALWIYGEDISGMANEFEGNHIVITTPDCEAMYYHRVMQMSGIPISRKALMRYGLMYYRYAKFASKYPVGENISYHLVGKADTEFLKRLNPEINAEFIRHPHYDVTEMTHSEAKSETPIRLLIAGRYDFTMSRAIDEAVTAMESLPQSVKSKYEITFLGKGWESSCDALVKSGYKSSVKAYVDDYAAEINSHHIQLTPICVGTGTKGKVLDAFANALMVIGTPLALENIAVEHGIDCVQYSTMEELSFWLTKLSDCPEEINRIARSGRNTVLEKHSRQKIADKFFCLFQH